MAQYAPLELAMKQALSPIRTPHLIALLACLSPLHSAWAQGLDPIRFPSVQITDTTLEYRQFEKVEITGSAILAKEAKQALPLQVIDRREIERSGATNLVELIQRLPVMSNFSELGAVTGTVTGGPEAAAVHGNQSGTLVLLNGRRLPYYGNQPIMSERTVVDLNLVPLSAIEKIEILTDGASSRYGSDAVAGVINIITKSEIQGLNIGAGLTLPQGGHGRGETVSLSWGKGQSQRDGYSVRAYFTAEKKEALLAKHREVSSRGARSVQINGQTYWEKYNTSFASAPAQNYIDAFGSLRNEHYDRTGQCAEGWLEIYRGYCSRDTQGDMTLYPAVDKQIFYVQADKLLPNGWTLFAEGLLGQQHQKMVPTGQYNQRTVLNADQSRDYFLEIPPLGLPTQKYTNSLGNLAVGLRGQQWGWDFVSSMSAGRHQVRRAYISGLVRGPFYSDAFSPELIAQHPDQYTAETLASLDVYRGKPLRLDDGFNRQNSVNFLASREWFETEHGPVQVGLGLDWRREQIGYESTLQLGGTPFQAKRQNWASHVEVNAPLGETTELTAALRHDQYSDFGHVQTGKLGWKWKPHDKWLLRASAGTGFRAPSLAQLLPIQIETTGISNPATGESIPIINQGNPLLQPERSVQKTLGFRYEPSQRLSVGADLWQLDIRDTFGVLTVNEILRQPASYAQYLSTGMVTVANQNLGQSIKRGLDYDVQVRQPTDWGRVRMTWRGVYMLKSSNQSNAAASFVSDLGVSGAGLVSTTARHQWVLSTVLERESWTGGFSFNYRSGDLEKSVLTSPDGVQMEHFRKIPAFWTVDVSGRWQLRQRTFLTASVVNLGNRLPPLRLITSNNVLLGVDTRTGNYWGRSLQLKVEHKF